MSCVKHITEFSPLKSLKQPSGKIPESDNSRFRDKNEISYEMKQHNYVSKPRGTASQLLHT